MLKLKPTKYKYAYCGPACLQMVLAYFGITATQKRLAKIAGTTESFGTSHKGMACAFRHFGFRVTTKRNHTSFDDLRMCVQKKKIPVIVNWYSTFNPPATGHYSIVTHITTTAITLMDPEIRRSRTMRLKDFNQVWFDFEYDLAFRTPPMRTDFRWMMVAEPKI